MQRLQWFVLVGCLLLVPTFAQAQASIAGVVRDSSGAVLPGVTVEASSPALIEKVRSVDDRRNRSVPDRRPAARQLHRHLHADGLQRRQAARHRVDRVVCRDRQCRLGGRIASSETITVTGEVADRGRSEHAGAATSFRPTSSMRCPTSSSQYTLAVLVPGATRDRRRPGRRRHGDDADHDLFDPRQPAVRPAPHGQRAHGRETSSRRPGPATSCPTWARPRKSSSTTRRGRPTRSAAGWASTSSRRKAATASWGRSSSPAPTARFRATTTPTS